MTKEDMLKEQDPDPSPYERFRALASAILSVPKRDIEGAQKSAIDIRKEEPNDVISQRQKSILE